MLPVPTTSEFLAVIVADVTDAAVAAIASPLTSVPSTPGWNAVSVLAHIAQNLAHFAAVVDPDYPDRVSEQPPPLGTDLDAWLADLAGWAERAAGLFASAMAEAPVDRFVSNWTHQDQIPRFQARRMAHETGLHLWDIEAACAGPPRPLGQAQDALSEYLQVIVPTWILPRRPAAEYPTVPLRLVASDSGDDRTLAVASGRIVDPRRPAGLIVSAASSDLVLWCTGRTELTALEVHGDIDHARAWQHMLRFSD